MSAVPAKIVGLELFGVLQLAYFTLGNVDLVNLLLTPLMNMKGLNGLNIPFANSDSSILPKRVKSIGYSPNFLDNCSVMLILVLAEMAVALIIYFLAFLIKSQSPRLYKIAKRMLKEFLLTLLVFNSFNIAYSAGIHFTYSK